MFNNPLDPFKQKQYNYLNSLPNNPIDKIQTLEKDSRPLISEASKEQIMSVPVQTPQTGNFNLFNNELKFSYPEIGVGETTPMMSTEEPSYDQFMSEAPKLEQTETLPTDNTVAMGGEEESTTPERTNPELIYGIYGSITEDGVNPSRMFELYPELKQFGDMGYGIYGDIKDGKTPKEILELYPELGGEVENKTGRVYKTKREQFREEADETVLSSLEEYEGFGGPFVRGIGTMGKSLAQGLGQLGSGVDDLLETNYFGEDEFNEEGTKNDIIEYEGQKYLKSLGYDDDNYTKNMRNFEKSATPEQKAKLQEVYKTTAEGMKNNKILKRRKQDFLDMKERQKEQGGNKADNLLDIAQGGLTTAFNVGMPGVTYGFNVAENTETGKEILEQFGSLLQLGGNFINRFPVLSKYKENLSEERREEFDAFVGQSILLLLGGKKGEIKKGTNIIDTLNKNKQYVIDNINPLNLTENFQKNLLNIGEGTIKAVKNTPKKIKEVINNTVLDPRTKKALENNPYTSKRWERTKKYIEDNGVSPEVKKEIKQAQIEELSTEIIDLIKDKKETLRDSGKLYDKIREADVKVDNRGTKSKLDKYLEEKGIRRDIDGKLDFSDSVVVKDSDMKAINKAYERATRDDYTAKVGLIQRKKLSDIAYPDGMKTPGTSIVKGMRKIFDETLKEKVPGLREADGFFSEKISDLNKIEENLVYRQGNRKGEIKDNFEQIINTLDGPNRSRMAKRLDELKPGILEEVQAVHLMPKVADAYFKTPKLNATRGSLKGATLGGVIGGISGGLPGAVAGVIIEHIGSKMIKKFSQNKLRKMIDGISSEGKARLKEINAKIEAGKGMSIEDKAYIENISKKIESKLKTEKTDNPLSQPKKKGNMLGKGKKVESKVEENLVGGIKGEGMLNKSKFSGFSYKDSPKVSKYKDVINDVKRVEKGEVKHPVTDTAKLSDIELPENKGKTNLVINKESLDAIKTKHGNFNIEDVVMTANEFDNGIYIKPTKVSPEKINLIKHTDDGYFVLGANRFNGFSTVTFFEKFPNTNKAKKYLQSIQKRGIDLSVGGTAEPLIHSSQKRGALASLSNINGKESKLTYTDSIVKKTKNANENLVGGIKKPKKEVKTKLEAPKSKLHEEAKKYKSADEFVESMESNKDIVYHTTNKKFDKFNLKKAKTDGDAGKGIYFSSNIEKTYGDNVIKGVLDIKRPLYVGESNLYTKTDISPLLKKSGVGEKLSNLNLEPQKINNLLFYARNGEIDFLKLKKIFGDGEKARVVIESLGYDGIIDNTVFDRFRYQTPPKGTTHYMVMSPKQIKTEAQLKKIREEANGKRTGKVDIDEYNKLSFEQQEKVDIDLYDSLEGIEKEYVDARGSPVYDIPEGGDIAMKNAINHGLNNVESHSLITYTDPVGEKFYNFNKRIRDGVELNEHYRTLDEVLKKTLKKLDKYEGTVYRGMADKKIQNMIKSLKPGDIMDNNGYISTSKVLNEAENFGGHPPFVMEIKSKNGRIIDKFSVSPDEAEVLFANGTKLKYNGIGDNGHYLFEEF